MEKLEMLSEQLTPVQIKNKEFNKTLLGYSPKEVVEFLDMVAKNWEKVQDHERQLLATLEELEKRLEGWKAKEAELEQLRIAAQREAAHIHEEATRDASKFLKDVQERAEQIREKTETWLEKVILQVEEAEQKKQDFLTSFRGALDKQYELLEDDGGLPKFDSHLARLRESASLAAKRN